MKNKVCACKQETAENLQEITKKCAKKHLTEKTSQQDRTKTQSGWSMKV